MATEKVLSAKLRTEDFGSSGSRRVVRSGRIPAVIYGKKGVAPVYVTLDAKEFKMKKNTFTETTLITLKLEGGEDKNVFVKEVQENLLKNCIQHVDLFEVTFGQLLRTKVRVELTGTPTGVRDGGVLEQVTHEIEIECFPRNLPEKLVADISGLGLNETFRISDLAIPETIKVLDDVETTIASVKMVKEEVEAAATEENAAPEVTTGAAAAATADAGANA
jgi:large subunit ribosomal protein L25